VDVFHPIHELERETKREREREF